MSEKQQPTEEQLEPIPTQEEIDAVFTWNAAPWLGKTPTAPDSVRLHCAKVLAEYGERLYGHEMEYFDQLNCITSAILRRAYLQATAALAASRRDAYIGRLAIAKEQAARDYSKFDFQDDELRHKWSDSHAVLSKAILAHFDAASTEGRA